MKPNSLISKRQRFVAEYLKDCNATQAAIRAGYSQRTAQQAGSRLLTDVVITSEIERRQAKSAMKADVSKDSNIAVLRSIRDTALREIVQFDGRTMTVADLASLTQAQALSMESLEVTDKGGLKVRMIDKIAAIKELNRMLGFTDNVAPVNQFNLQLNLGGPVACLPPNSPVIEAEVVPEGVPAQIPAARRLFGRPLAPVIPAVVEKPSAPAQHPLDPHEGLGKLPSDVQETPGLNQGSKVPEKVPDAPERKGEE